MTRSITTDRPSGVPQGVARPLSPAVMQRRMRDIHLYLSMLFAPSLLFFAATGALQLFNLHEVRPNRSFEPPALLQELGMVHKNQVFALPRHRGPPPAPPQDASPDAQRPPIAAPPQTAGGGESWEALALKIFFLLASIGLFVSTCLGIWIALRPGRNRRLGIGLFAAGVVIPVVLLAL